MFKWNKEVIRKDQTLRAYGIGDSALSNVHYGFRRAYSKLYYNFKPNYFWWIEMQILRKLGLVAISMIFSGNPTFQLSVALLLMFVCYSAQVQCKPYLGWKEKAQIIQSEGNKAILKQMGKMEALSSLGGGGKMSIFGSKKKSKKVDPAILEEKLHHIRSDITSIRTEMTKCKDTHAQL